MVDAYVRHACVKCSVGKFLCPPKKNGTTHHCSNKVIGLGASAFGCPTIAIVLNLYPIWSSAVSICTSFLIWFDTLKSAVLHSTSARASIPIPRKNPCCVIGATTFKWFGASFPSFTECIRNARYRSPKLTSAVKSAVPGLQNAMTSSGERTSAESQSRRPVAGLPHREVTDGFLQSPFCLSKGDEAIPQYPRAGSRLLRGLIFFLTGPSNICVSLWSRNARSVSVFTALSP